MSSPPQQRQWTPEDYLQAMRDYGLSLPQFHFQKSRSQSTQQEIIFFALSEIRRRRPQLHYINDMLIQQLVEGRLVQVVPTTLVILGNLPFRMRQAYQPQEELPVFWALDSIDPGDPEGRFARNRDIFEHELRVPYYLTHEAGRKWAVLCLYRHDGTAYQPAPVNEHGRYPVPELDIEVGMINGWARLWFEGKLLPLISECSDEWWERREREWQRGDESARQNPRVAEGVSQPRSHPPAADAAVS